MDKSAKQIVKEIAEHISVGAQQILANAEEYLDYEIADRLKGLVARAEEAIAVCPAKDVSEHKGHLSKPDPSAKKSEKTGEKDESGNAKSPSSDKGNGAKRQSVGGA